MWDLGKMHSYRAEYWDASKYHANLLKHFCDSVFFPHSVFPGRGMGYLGTLITTETLLRTIDSFM